MAAMLTERIFQLAFWSALIFALIMATLPQPPALPGEFNDKIQHVLAFLALAALAPFAYPRLRLFTIFLGLSLVGGLIEIVQMIPDLGRRPSLTDWLADIAATAAMLIVIGAFRAVRSAISQRN